MPRRRRRTLRTIGLIFLAALLVWAALEVPPARARRQAVQHLELVGGDARYLLRYIRKKPGLPGSLRENLGLDLIDFVYLVRMNGVDLGREEVDALLHLERLVGLELNDSRVTIHELERLSALPRLAELDIRSAAIDNSSIAVFQRFPNLRHLDARETGIDLDGARALVRAAPRVRLLVDGSESWVEAAPDVSAAN